MELNPHFSEAYYNRGHVFIMIGELPRAIQKYDRALALDNDNERSHYECAVAHGKLGNHQEAIRHYNRVITLNPESEQAYFNRGIAHARIGSYYQ